MVMFVLGLISLVFGVAGELNHLTVSENSDMLLGMFTGFGATFVVISSLLFLRNRFVSAEKQKKDKINLTDERNIQIKQIAGTMTNVVSILLQASMAFVFVALDYRIPAFIVVGALLIQMIAYLLFNAYYNKKI